MHIDAKGYVFEGKCVGRIIAVKEEYSVFNGIADITVGVTQNGSIPPAVTYLPSTGFIRVSDRLKVSDIDTFLKSRKGTYCILGNVTMLCCAKIVVATNEIRRLELYTPISEAEFESGGTAILCDRLSESNGFHHKVVKGNLLEAIKTNLYNDLQFRDFSSRKAYLEGRV